MDKNTEEKVWKEIIDTINKNDKQKNIMSYIHKVPLYSFKTTDPQKIFCLGKDNFTDIFEFIQDIFVTIIDGNQIQEIKTGMIFPIVDLEQRNESWNSHYIRYCKPSEDYTLFTLSQNKFLESHAFCLKELEQYLEKDNNAFADNLKTQEQQKNKVYLKFKSIKKKNTTLYLF